MGWKSARRFKAGSGRGIGVIPDAAGCFSVCGNSVLLCMDFCEELRYNLDAGKEWQIRSYRVGKF